MSLHFFSFLKNSRGVDVNKAIGREIHRLAVAYDLADDGIV